MAHSLLALHRKTNSQANSKLIIYYVWKSQLDLYFMILILKIHDRTLDPDGMRIISPILESPTIISSSVYKIFN